jgi:hypothetical protein
MQRCGPSSLAVWCVWPTISDCTIKSPETRIHFVKTSPKKEFFFEYVGPKAPIRINSCLSFPRVFSTPKPPPYPLLPAHRSIPKTLPSHPIPSTRSPHARQTSLPLRPFPNASAISSNTLIPFLPSAVPTPTAAAPTARMRRKPSASSTPPTPII